MEMLHLLQLNLEFVTDNQNRGRLLTLMKQSESETVRHSPTDPYAQYEEEEY